MPFFTTTTRPAYTPVNKDTMGTVKAGRKLNATNPSTNTTTEVTNTNAPITSEPRVLKAVREFEHGRQRAKKSARTESWKAEKVAKRQLKAQRAQGTLVEGIPIHRSRKGGFVHLDRDETSLDESDSAEEAFDIEVVETPKWREDKLEVDLTKLIRPSKARRSKAGDFELIPSVRSVLVLEDAVLDRGFDSIEDDEPWEYLSAAGDDAEHNIPSYAEVAANTR
ncbi:hypothetical protein QCA50_002426 [Cerrena zonata]|uniref:Uncharacterized protein n=1 Tax=Cerrena zonata TaxID=2478898 RepID=A0AAW0GZ51_9APHY